MVIYFIDRSVYILHFKTEKWKGVACWSFTTESWNEAEMSREDLLTPGVREHMWVLNFKLA